MKLNTLIIWKDSKYFKHLSSILNANGHSVIETSNDKKGMTILQKEIIDIIFYELEELEEHEEHKKNCFTSVNMIRHIIHSSVPVVIYSNIDNVTIAMNAMLAGADDYFVKTILKPDELETKLKGIINKSKKVLKLNIDLKKYKTQSLLDSLTGLTNRRGIDKFLKTSLAYAARHECPLACFYVDLDDFKPINDKYGHDYGDLVLREVSARIKTMLRTEDLIGRYGGDEFVIIVLGLNNISKAAILANKILSCLRRSINCDKNDLYVNASIGISFSQKEITSENLISEAEEAMRNSKKEGKGLFTFYKMLHD